MPAVTQMASVSTPQEPPKSIAQYQLGDCIGKGAFGSVFRGLNMETGEVVAIKQVKLTDIPKSEVDVIMVQPRHYT